jgi:L-rhamnose mutarotase
MRTYEELVAEFSSRGSEDKNLYEGTNRQKWVGDLPIEEIKVLINGLSNVGIWDSWIKYMEMIILTKIEEERARKLKELGI